MPSSPESAMRTERTTVLTPDGTRLSVLIAEPSRPAVGLPPVLAVHGFGSSAEYTWAATGHLAALTRAGRRVIAPDLRGHGLSDRPHRPAAYRFDALLADLRTVVVRRDFGTGAAGGLGIDDFGIDVLGYSLGARLSWSLAAAGGTADLRVRRLVLGGYDGRVLFEGVDPGLLAGLVGEAAQGRSDAPIEARTGQAESVAARARQDARSGADPTRRIAGIVHAVPGNDRDALAALVAGLPGTAPPDPEPAVPTLVAAGTADSLASGAELLAAGLRDGEYLPIPGRDHISAVTSSVFRRGVVEFLGRT